MHTHRLGKNHLAVSAMGLGCWGMSHVYGPADEKESLAAIENVLVLWIIFFDTADVYGSGHNEALIPGMPNIRWVSRLQVSGTTAKTFSLLTTKMVSVEI